MGDEQIIDAVKGRFPGIYDGNDVLEKGLKQMTPAIKEALVQFLQNNSHPEMNLLGFTVDKLKNEYNQNDVAAYLTLDFISRSPKEAIESLEKGIK